MAPSEVFPVNRLMDRPSGLSEDRIEAPDADVVRAAMMAATQAALVVEVADESRGVILASRELQDEGHGRSQPAMHYYAIAIVEKGPALTDVHVQSKVQESCEKPDPGAWLLVGVMLVFVIGLFSLGAALTEARQCEEHSSTMRPTGGESERILNAIRNNLPRAGAR